MYSRPYQTKKRLDVEIKSKSVNGRMFPSKYEKLIRKYGSFQKFLDSIQIM